MRFYLALFVAKIINFGINTLNLGAGYTWPGHVALMIYPNVLQDQRLKFSKGVVLITGTNGKTTTAKLVRSILLKANVPFTHNLTGANLLNGIVSATLLNTTFFGKQLADVGLFEVDEFTLPSVLAHVKPKALVLLNLSRDQLDRYGEVDIILQRWEKSFDILSNSTHVIYDEDQKSISNLLENFKVQKHSFNASRENLKKTSLFGSFNARNSNAAVIVAKLLDIDSVSISKGLSSFKPAYGRGEIIKKDTTDFQIFLAKNPASFNNNLSMLLEDSLETDAILYILNDEIRDGRDVSWIYDINADKLKNGSQGKKIYVAGTRSLDMAVRLQYSGVELHESNVFDSLSTAVKNLSEDSTLNKVLCFPNYSAMLALRKELVGREIL